jgi:hypothetical protein
MHKQPVKESGLANLALAAANPRLSEILFDERDRSFASIAAFPSNVEAIEAALMFTTGIHQRLAIVGPSGWGKTHLLSAVCNLVSRERDAAVDRISVLDFLSAPGREAQHLILDDVQDVFSRPRARQSLHLALTRRVRSSRPTVLAFTAAKPSRQIRALLPNSREWIIVTIGEPHAEERILLLNHMGRQEGLALCPRLVKVLAYQMKGDGRTYVGALKRLRTVGASWSAPEESLRALGLLDPFFRDNAGWDLKLNILGIADEFGSPCPGLAPLDLALYVMLHLAELAEADVARAAGLAPAEVYHRANRFASQAASSLSTATGVLHFVELVVSSLAEAR